MKKTHYELQQSRIAKYRDHSLVVLEALEDTDGNSGFYIERILRNRGLLKIPSHGIDVDYFAKDKDRYGYRFDSFFVELFHMWLRRYAVDGEAHCMSQLTLTDKDFIRTFSTMASAFGGVLQCKLEYAYHFLNHEDTGKKVFDVTPGLAEKLLHTELRGLKTDDVMLPFPNVYIQVPTNTGFKIFNDDTGWHDVDGLYITEDKKGRYEPARSVISVDRHGVITCADGLNFEDRERVRIWHIMVCAGPNENSPDSGDDALMFFKLYMRKGQSVDEAVDELASRFDDKRFTETWSTVFRWALNAIVYATYSDPGEEVWASGEARKLWERILDAPENSKTRRNLENKARQQGIDPDRHIVLGKNIFVDRRRPLPGHDSKATGRKLEIRTLVKGFWRQQVCGKGRLERKRIFVQPFWRGPEDSVQSTSRKHILK